VKNHRLNQRQALTSVGPIETPLLDMELSTMNTRSIKIALMTAGLAAAPTFSVAANAPVAMDSCVKAFMANLSTTMARTPKLQQWHYIDDMPGGNSMEWTLMARTRMTITRSRAVCTVNPSGPSHRSAPAAVARHRRPVAESAHRAYRRPRHAAVVRAARVQTSR
jgi:hypothetical protein